MGRYNTYRGTLGVFGTYGSCLHDNLGANADSDPSVPDPNMGYFYLVTAENRISQEGVKGYDSGGTPDPNPDPCP